MDGALGNFPEAGKAARLGKFPGRHAHARGSRIFRTLGSGRACAAIGAHAPARDSGADRLVHAAAAELAQPGPSPERAVISVTRDTAAVLRTKRGAPFPSSPLDLGESIRTVRSGLLINPYPLDDDARGAEPENDLRAFSGRRSFTPSLVKQEYAHALPKWSRPPPSPRASILFSNLLLRSRIHGGQGVKW